MHPWVIYANEISRDRERRLSQLVSFDEERWLLAQSIPPSDSRSWHIRRRVAQALAVASRTTATVVRQLDECVADDLGRSLAPTE